MEAGPPWKVLVIYMYKIKKHGLAINELWTCSKVFIASLDLFVDGYGPLGSCTKGDKEKCGSRPPQLPVVVRVSG